MAKTTFVLDSPTSEPSQVVTFKTYLDEDGDLRITANGANIAFIEASTGKLHRFYVPTSFQPAGLSFEDDGRLSLVQ